MTSRIKEGPWHWRWLRPSPPTDHVSTRGSQRPDPARTTGRPDDAATPLHGARTGPGGRSPPKSGFQGVGKRGGNLSCLIDPLPCVLSYEVVRSACWCCRLQSARDCCSGSPSKTNKEFVASLPCQNTSGGEPCPEVWNRPNETKEATGTPAPSLTPSPEVLVLAGAACNAWRPPPTGPPLCLPCAVPQEPLEERFAVATRDGPRLDRRWEADGARELTRPARFTEVAQAFQ